MAAVGPGSLVGRLPGVGIGSEEEWIMSDNWRTDEPEVGAVAWLEFEHEKIGPTICVRKPDGILYWEGHLYHYPMNKRWQPITTPEEQRLRAEVVKLKDDLHHTCQAVDCTEQACKELRAEVERLREAARWRKWPEEKPDEPMVVWLITEGGSKGVGYFNGREINDGNKGWNGHVTNWTHWRPIGELPKTETGGAGDEPGCAPRNIKDWGVPREPGWSEYSCSLSWFIGHVLGDLPKTLPTP